MPSTVLHLSPHPDDEVVGMPATLMALRDAGWRIVNLACGLGRPAQHQRRRAEVEEACRRAGFELLPCEPPLPLSAGDDLARRGGRARDACSRECSPRSTRRSCAPRLRTTGTTRTSSSAAPRAARSRRTPGPAPPLWLWGVWADLPFPTLIVALRRGRGWRRSSTRSRPTPPSMARLPLDRLVEARAVLAAGRRRGARVRLGLSTAIPPLELAELLCEVVLAPAGWRLGSPRRFDAEAPLASALRAPDRLVARGRVGARAPAPWRAAALTQLLSARRCAARRARSGTRA